MADTPSCSVPDGDQPAVPPAGPPEPGVLFLCVHNAGRSQMAAGWLRHLAHGKVRVYSGGSSPGPALNPAVVDAMAEVGIDIRDEFPKAWTAEVLGTVDVVVTMGCGDACPVYPGKRYIEWDLDDPAGQSIESIRVTRDTIRLRVEGLVQELAARPA